MNVVHLSTRDTQGGAAGSAYRLHGGLLESGLESRMYVRFKDSSDPTVLQHEPRSAVGHTLRRVYRRGKIWLDFQKYRLSRPNDLEPFSDSRSGFQLHRVQELDPDLINLHWVSSFVDYQHFFEECIGDTPVVWRLSDLNPFTGGCHYDQGCGKYRNSCGACPQLGSTNEKDLSREIWNRKQTAFSELSDNQLHFVAQSNWIRDQVEASSLTGRFPVTVIPNGLDETLFRPRDTEGIRAVLDIPATQKVILFVAQSTRNYRKGFDLLSEALSLVSDKNALCLSIGGGEPNLDTSLRHIHIGKINDDQLLAEFYSLADLFVIPSRQDNLPNTVLESMACGTPVVGFDTGGIPDMVRPEETGWLAETGDVRSLRYAIETALTNDAERERKAARCREVVEEEYTLEKQAEQYVSLYRSLL